MWASESLSFPWRMTSSMRRSTCRVIPCFFSISCCSNSLSMRGWFQREKNIRESHFLLRSIMASNVGEHAAEPTKPITKSNTPNIWYTRCAMLVDFPHLLLPTAASTRGTRSAILLGSHSVNTIINFIRTPLFYAGQERAGPN